MATNRKTTSTVVKKDDVIKCLICSSEMKSNEFYKSRHSLIDSCFSVCKNCACREANKDVDGLHKILMILDVPFLPELYKECEGNDNVFSQYMLRVNNPKKKYEDGRKYMELTYGDSPTLSIVTNVDEFIYKSNEDIAELQDLFGDWWKKDQLYAMNKELDKMFLQYGGSRDNMPMLDLYCELIRLKWLSMERYAHGDSKEGKALSDARQKLLKDNGMNVQAMRDKKNNDSTGEKIDWVEYEPILPSKKYYDIDGIMFMWKMLIDQMLRFVGANKKPVDEDAMEMIKYVEEHPEYVDEIE